MYILTGLMQVDLLEVIRENREEILRIATIHGATRIQIFGSVARGEERPESDIDFLVELVPGRSLLDQVALKQDLENLLNCSVDVVTEGELHWYIKEQVLREAVPL